jgi:hypothetical protein
MAIEIGAQITGIVQREVVYSAGDPPAAQTLFVRDVAFKIVGMPPEVFPVPTFMIAVTDAGQWDTLQVGQTCTITITPPP